MKKVLYIFSQLTDGDVDWMVASGTSHRVPSGSVLIRQGSESDSLYVIVEGHVMVSTEGAGEVSRLGWGEIVGEMSLVDRGAASATVTAMEDGMVLELPRSALEPKLARDPGFAARLYHAIALVLTDRLRNALRLLDKSNHRGEATLAEEISPELMDNLHLAGARFDRMQKNVIKR